MPAPPCRLDYVKECGTGVSPVIGFSSVELSVLDLSSLGSYDKASKENWNLRRDGERYTKK